MEIEFEMPELAPFQEEWLQHPARIKAVEGATWTGKTFVLKPHLFKAAHYPVNRGDEYWWIGPSVDKAKEVFQDIVRRLEDADLIGTYPINKTDRTITTPAGGVAIYHTGEKPELLYGTPNVRMIVVDEFTRCRPALWAAIFSVSNKTGCPIFLIGNYVGETSAWHLLLQQLEGMPEFKYFKTTAQAAVNAGIMPQERMELARRSLPNAVFMALYMCEGSHDPFLLVDYAAVSDLWLNEHVPEGDPALTCDIALHGSDQFVIGLWSGMILKDIDVFTKLPPQDVVKIIEGKATAHAVPRSNIVYDADGLGAYLKGYLKGGTSFQGGTIAIPFSGNKLSYQNLRSQCHFMTADAINARGIWIQTTKYREEMEQEIFACLRHNGQTAAGQWRVVSKDSTDPDNPGPKARLSRSPDKFDIVQMRQLLNLRPKATLIDNLHREGERKRTLRFNRPRDEGSKFRIEGR